LTLSQASTSLLAVLTYFVVGLLGFQGVALARHALRQRKAAPRDVRVAAIRVVLEGVGRDRVLGELVKRARAANPDSRAGRANLVHDVARVLGAAQPSWRSCAIDVSPPASRRDAQRRLDRLVHELRLAGEHDGSATWLTVALRGELPSSPADALAQLTTTLPDDVLAAEVVAPQPQSMVA
jgi:hypothetical protein